MPTMTAQPSLEEARDLLGRKLLAQVAGRPAGQSEYVAGTLVAVATQLDGDGNPMLVIDRIAGAGTVFVALSLVTTLRPMGAIPSADRAGVPR